jgi:putative FmdB family regulatory protein
VVLAEACMMPVYVYRCECGARFEQMASIANRNKVHCECGKLATIELQPVQGTFRKQARLITEAQTEAEYGPRWRETKASRRMAAGEPERLYSFRTRD